MDPKRNSIVNLCSHSINLYDRSTEQPIEIFEPSGMMCRCLTATPDEKKEEEAKIVHNGFNLPAKWAPVFVAIEGLPSDENPPDILVSLAVGDFIRNNPSLYEGGVYGPDSGPEGALRDANGNIIGTFNLLVYKERSC